MSAERKANKLIRQKVRRKRAVPPPHSRACARQARGPCGVSGPQTHAQHDRQSARERDGADELGRRLGPRAAPSRFEKERPAPEC